MNLDVRHVPRTSAGILLACSFGICTSGEILSQEVMVSGTSMETVIEVIDHEKASKIKAVFIFQISQFVKWPDTDQTVDNNSDFRIGVVGSGMVHRTLIDISKRREIHGRTVRVLPVSTEDEIRQGEFEVLYFAPTVSLTDAAKMISRLGDWPVLIFTDHSNRPSNTIVNFLIENQNVVFELNNQEAQRRKLAMDAKLLRQGRVMQSTTP